MSAAKPTKTSGADATTAKKQKLASPLLKFFRIPALSSHKTLTLLANMSQWLKDTHPDVECTLHQVETEVCFFVEPKAETNLTSQETERLIWLLSETFEPQNTKQDVSFLPNTTQTSSRLLVEIGPRMNFSTAWSSNAVAICQACGITNVKRIERATRYLIRYVATESVANEVVQTAIKHALFKFQCDRMTQQEYTTTLTSFAHGKTVQPTRKIPIMAKGMQALKQINDEIGLGFDDWDLNYYLNLFQHKLKRDPTDVECFDMGQSNSEHCRHWFFSGKMEFDGKAKPMTLFQLVKSTLTEEAQTNSVIAFHDNSSVIEGFPIETIGPVQAGKPSKFAEQKLTSHLLLTAETHNFPSGVAPFPGAETGTGGRIRDVQATGRGAHVIAGSAAYAVGNLLLEDYKLPWEDATAKYPSNLANPLDILIQASNGASDYGNKFGEPVVTGYARSFGMKLPHNQERREYLKPIMFSGGLGFLDDRHRTKQDPDVNMWVVKIGGPAYRIGMGGGAASSRIQDSKNAELDFNAVQRGDAEMENKMNKVIRACVQLGDKNPIVSIHDQGAGGNGNVLKEIVEMPATKQTPQNRGGARYEVRKLLVGDETLSVLEIWGAEYQENNALLLRAEHKKLFDEICAREKCPYSFLGQVTGDGRVVLHDELDDSTPVDLDLDLVLGKMPQKVFKDTSLKESLKPLTFPEDITLLDALDRVLRLLSVGSKRFLTNKVDRSVSGLIAQQQTVGPLQLTMANCGVIAQSHFPHDGVFTGVATSVGEQPVKGLVNPGAMARLSVAESLTNLVWASIGGRGIKDCKCSANWMWAAKLPHEAVRMYQCCEAMTNFMKEIGVAVDGGKDSLSMAAKVEKKDVKAPGTLVISMYAPCDDVEKTVTPDLKNPGAESVLLYVDLGKNKYRLGGSALAQVYNQVGDVSPDMEDAQLFVKAFGAVQKCIKQRLLLAGHDRSDGGLLVTLLEMAFAGNCGFDVEIPYNVTSSGSKLSLDQVLAILFAEELGFVMQVEASKVPTVRDIFTKANAPLVQIGKVLPTQKVVSLRISRNGAHHVVLTNHSMVELRDVWEATSFALEKKQCDPECVMLERHGLRNRTQPDWQLSFEPKPTPQKQLSTRNQHRVAILREEGSNGEREMLSAFHAAGFEVWDVTMTDLVRGKVVLDDKFRGVAFVGGFSYADVLGSAKGWAGVVRFHDDVLKQFQAFRERKDTFSLGICNGCQLMALLGWLDVPDAKRIAQETKTSSLPRFIHNDSGRFESRFVSIQIQKSPSVLLRGMAKSSFGVWIAHGEGKVHFSHGKYLQNCLQHDLAPVRYVDDANHVTEQYPFNPNGSPKGIAALCSKDGRHLCMMPHPERCFLKWQWPYMPQNLKQKQASPWLQMFQNAKSFCEEQTSSNRE